mmetsp:Transcript_30206/g.78302  ORF Transcript_30206/g.78302 Transcript_30206/m.78302 type:complete len:87 (+) Transcript_30206:451-711(+)
MCQWLVQTPCCMSMSMCSGRGGHARQVPCAPRSEARAMVSVDRQAGCQCKAHVQRWKETSESAADELAELSRSGLLDDGIDRESDV